MTATTQTETTITTAEQAEQTRLVDVMEAIDRGETVRRVVSAAYNSQATVTLFFRGGRVCQENGGDWVWGDEDGWSHFVTDDGLRLDLDGNLAPADLVQLCGYVEAGHYNDRQKSELPTFGGEAPDDTNGVYSWDATRLLTQGRMGWTLVSRASIERDAASAASDHLSAVEWRPEQGLTREALGLGGSWGGAPDGVPSGLWRISCVRAVLAEAKRRSEGLEVVAVVVTDDMAPGALVAAGIDVLERVYTDRWAGHGCQYRVRATRAALSRYCAERPDLRDWDLIEVSPSEGQS